MTLPADTKVTTETLWYTTLIFAPIDAVFVSILAGRIDETGQARSERDMAAYPTALSVHAPGWYLAGTEGGDRVYPESVYNPQNERLLEVF